LTNLTMDRALGVSGKKRGCVSAVTAPAIVARNDHAMAMSVFLMLSADYLIFSRGDFRISANAVVPVTGNQTGPWSCPASRTSTDCQIVEIVLIWCRSSHSRYRVGERR